MRRLALDPGWTVDEIMRGWPATIRVMLRHRMLCVGCPVGIFHTVADACAAHGIDREAFEAELLRAMRGDPAVHRRSAGPRRRKLRRRPPGA